MAHTEFTFELTAAETESFFEWAKAIADANTPDDPLEFLRGAEVHTSRGVEEFIDLRHEDDGSITVETRAPDGSTWCYRGCVLNGAVDPV